MAILTSSKDDLQLSGFQFRALAQLTANFQDGIIAKAGQECEVTYSGLNLTIGTGLGVISGVIFQITEPITLPLDTGSVAGTKKVLITTDGGAGDTIGRIADDVENNTNLIENPQGSKDMSLAIVSHSGSGITGLDSDRNIISGEVAPTKIIKDFHEAPISANETFDWGYTQEQMVNAKLVKGVFCDSKTGTDLGCTLIGNTDANKKDLYMFGSYESGNEGLAICVMHIQNTTGTTWRVNRIRRSYLNVDAPTNDLNSLTQLTIEF